MSGRDSVMHECARELRRVAEEVDADTIIIEVRRDGRYVIRAERSSFLMAEVRGDAHPEHERPADVTCVDFYSACSAWTALHGANARQP